MKFGKKNKKNRPMHQVRSTPKNKKDLMVRQKVYIKSNDARWAPPAFVRKVHSVDFILLGSVLILLMLGMVVLYSASSPTAYLNEATHHDSFYFMKRQMIWGIIGVFGMFFFSNVNYKKLGKKSLLVFAISITLLVCVILFGIRINGAKRWLGLTSTLGFQPSEFAKIANVIFLAFSLSKNKDNLKYFWAGLFPYLIIIGLYAALLMLEPHFSCTLIIAATAVCLLFIAGAKIKHFVILSLPVIVGLSCAIIFAPYRMKRLLTFFNPFSDPSDNGYQIIQSLLAIGSGGIFGRGLGQSRQKYLYLPEPQNDFIFSILCEELGLIGAIFTIFMFLILIWRGIRIASNINDLFGSFLVSGFTSIIAIQFLTNIAVVTSSIPATGMPLPFFSYGGTALVFTLISVGIMLNVSKYA